SKIDQTSASSRPLFFSCRDLNSGRKDEPYENIPIVSSALCLLFALQERRFVKSYLSRNQQLLATDSYELHPRAWHGTLYLRLRCIITLLRFFCRAISFSPHRVYFLKRMDGSRP